jgi:oligosaccharyltransferase complex subunit alpha (ribophorin I)
MKGIAFVFLTILLIINNANAFVNKDVKRKIDLQTHIVKVTHLITTEGSAPSYTFVVDSGFEDHLSYIAAMSKVGDEEKEFAIEESKQETPHGKQYSIQLKPSGQKQYTFTVVTIYTHKLVPYPTEITQNERQFIKFLGNVYFNSPYPTETQETQVVLPSPVNILSYEKTPEPVKKQDAILIYGPYKNQPANSKGPLALHYENNNPFLTVTHLTRVIELSHWGNIAVEETIDLYHSGARLKGAFSRYEYQRNQGGASSVKSIKSVLPAAAKDVYYRDEIGNISTSHLRELMDSVEIELRPRFPLFGGWKTHYTIGYNVPTYEYLYRKGSQYGLRMRFLDHIFDDQIVDQMTLKIVLPEAVSKIRFNPPFAVQEGPREVLKTYLDTTGRTVVVAYKSNLVEQHIKDFEIYYEFQSWLMIREPLMIITAFCLLFIAVIVYVRLDFSITKDEASECRMRVSGLVEEVRTTQDRRSALYQSYEDALNKYKSSKDASIFAQNRKKIDSDHAQLTQQMNTLQAKLKQDSPAAADKVAEIQNLDTRYRELVAQSISFAERLVTSKMDRQTYVQNEQKIAPKKQEILQRAEVVLASL